MLFDYINIVAFILFLAGIVLLAVEIAIPGVGIPGVLSFLCFIIGIIFQARSWAEGLIMFAVLAAVFGVLLFLFIRMSKKKKSGIVLKDTVGDDTPDYSSRIGRPGVSASYQHPYGEAIIDGEHYDVTSLYDYIEKGTPIVVSAVENQKIIVKRQQQ